MHMLKRMKSKVLKIYDKYKDEIKYEDSDYPHIKMTWNEEKPETMRSLCPKLFEGFYLEVE